jgi:hypothetical protein
MVLDFDLSVKLSCHIMVLDFDLLVKLPCHIMVPTYLNLESLFKRYIEKNAFGLAY